MPKTPSSTINRRQFIRYSTFAAGTAFASGPFLLRGRNLNDKLNVAVIGANGKGASDTDGVAGTGQNIVAICDIDEKNLEERGAKYPAAKRYRDYRKMLEAEKNIDAVTVSTPDHHHAFASMMAIKLHRNVYCQKPLTHSIYEARALTEAARKYKVATMMGNQGHSSSRVRTFAEMIWAGAIGKVREVHCWTDRPIWPQGLTRPKDVQPIPANIDWDMFIGPAPMRPYHSGYQPFAWRGWWDFGTGALGDMACHVMDPANFALQLANPTSVEAQQEGNTEESGPKWSIIRYEFPQRHAVKNLGGENVNPTDYALGPVSLTWYDGGKKPSADLMGLAAGEKMPDNGSLFVGDDGVMFCETYGEGPRFVGKSKGKVFQKPAETIARAPGHYEEFVRACKGGVPAGSNFNYAGPFTEIVLLGNLAVRSGKKIEWDSKKLKAKNAPELDHLIHRQYRSGWSL
jgi:predicted dehydrogenase